MSAKVNLPPGCGGFTCADGTRYDARPGTSVVVSDRHADALDRSQYAEKDLLTAKQPLSFGTKRGRWCQACRRVWNAWNDVCPRCGAETVEHERKVGPAHST